MRLLIQLDLEQARLWHLHLVERIAKLPHVGVAVTAGRGRPVPRWVDSVLSLEARLQGGPKPKLFARIDGGRLRAFSAGEAFSADITLVLGGDPGAANGTTWRVLIDGAAGEDALLHALVSRRQPIIAVHDGTTVIAAGRVGTDLHGHVSASLDNALARLISLLAGIVGGARPELPGSDLLAPSPARSATMTEVAGFAAKSLARLSLRSAYRLLYHSPHWRVGWRHIGSGTTGEDVLSGTGWTDLPDDGHRFYADPVPLLHRGQVTLFVEEYPHATGKGIISAVGFDRSGPIGRPEPVLERPYHLSYPFVFERGGDVWMIPESGASGTIDLFRSTCFPGGWVKERTLVSDVTASDATLFETEGRWWMFATVRDGGSHSDMLCLWSAPDFIGPWTPHSGNPVLIDCVSARPAGRMFTKDGRIYRPAQDCRATYGAALTIAEVLQLDERDFRQAITTIVRPGPCWPGRHLHTLNSAGGFEFIDGTGTARRLWQRRAASAPIAALPSQVG